MKKDIEYQGWTNSATWSAAYITQQEPAIYKELVAIRKSGKQVTADDVWYQYNKLNLKIDNWTIGLVNWQEIADTHYNNEDFV